MEQKIFRAEQLSELKDVVAKVKAQNVFLVRANKSYFNSGADGFIQTLVCNNEVVSFSEFDPNPQLEDLKKGIEIFKKGNFDLIIAIGGGSVLDMAKLISVFAHQKAVYEDIVQGKESLMPDKTSLLAIPTTAGTGAEATQFAVLYMGKVKYSVAGTNFLPDYVYLSHEFSMSANSYLTACTGLDAFSQAVESLWSVNATAESEQFAVEAIRIIWRNLKRAVKDNNAKAKSNMQEASFLAGKAINITKTTAPHALSYAFTSYYGIPHGHAVAISLPFFLHFNYHLNEENCIDPSGFEAVKKRIDNLLAVMDVTIEKAAGEMVAFFEELGIDIQTKRLISDFDPLLIVDNVNLERLSNNPRKVDKNDILNIFG